MIAGVIIGKALYSGAFTLEPRHAEAVAKAKAEKTRQGINHRDAEDTGRR